MQEFDFIDLVRPLAFAPGARSLADDAAVLEIGGSSLVLTHDMIAEGVHYLRADPPEDVAWKIVAVNLSDLAAKGARPVAALLGFTLGDNDWDRRFADGLGTALQAFGVPLMGGDTIALPGTAPRVIGLTAIGATSGPVPARSGASPGDRLWVTGTIGDSGAGLKALQRAEEAPFLVERYRQPRPRLEAGQRLAPHVSAMMDVSDGLLIDASRLMAASGCAATIRIDDLPLSPPFIAFAGDNLAARITAASAGDDFELLFAAPTEATQFIHDLADEIGITMSPIGDVSEGAGLGLTFAGDKVPLPDRLGFVHGR